jgi:outer membrane protein TolC
MTIQIGIYDHITGQQTTREMTSEELSAHKTEIAKHAADKAAKEAEKQAAKEALLTTLGITEQQAIIVGLIQAPILPKETTLE